jgi:sec-independent protein translocase protein TatA
MFHPVLAIIDMPIILVVVGAAVLLFGYDKIPKLARSAGQAKKEFMMGQIEADEAANKAREEARQRIQTANADPMDNVQAGAIDGEHVRPPTDHGTGA